jgi:hypothetical protein
VFENELVELDAAGTLSAAEANEHALITVETQRLHIAAHWADIHPGDAVRESRVPRSERPVQLGEDGTPTVGGFSPAELGCALRMSDGSASRLIGDALDLRHRLRQIWAAALAGPVPAHHVRRSKAIGILAQPAQALQLLCQHQDNDWDGPIEPADPAEGPGCEEAEATATDGAAHRSLQISPPPFHPDRTRHLAMAITPPPHLPRQRQRHPTPSATPSLHKCSGAPRHVRR